MLQIAAVVVGIIAIIMAISAITKKEIALSSAKRLTGRSAIIVGLAILFLGIVIVVFGLIGIPWLTGAFPPRSGLPTNVQELPADQQLVVQWENHSTSDKRCSAEFPSPPTPVNVEIDGRILERLTLQRIDGKGHYALSCTELSQTDADQPVGEVLEKSKEAFFAAILPDGGRFKLVSESKIEQDGVSGYQMEATAGPSSVSLSRTFLHAGRMYRASVIIAAGKKDDVDAKRFLESLRFSR